MLRAGIAATMELKKDDDVSETEWVSAQPAVGCAGEARHKNNRYPDRRPRAAELMEGRSRGWKSRGLGGGCFYVSLTHLRREGKAKVTVGLSEHGDAGRDHVHDGRWSPLQAYRRGIHNPGHDVR